MTEAMTKCDLSLNESRREKKKAVFRVSDTNRVIQPQKTARGLKFKGKVGEELYYP